jgi:hypothetical protein
MHIAELEKAAVDLNARIRENRTSLVTLGVDAGILSREFGKLRIALINEHMENQRNAID